MSLALRIAENAIALNWDDFNVDARRFAKEAIADMIGCALLGADADITRAVLASGEFAPGGCLVLGHKLRLGRLDAALVNGASGHALDYDDTSKSMAGHPTVIIIPALLALAESRNASGRDVLDAYIVGIETATRIARGVNFHHYEKGWHPTSTLGIFGAAAACSRMLRHDARTFAHTLSICTSFASATKANFGTPIKPLHAGMAARNALFAALLADQGIAASPNAFEHPSGFLDVFNGPGNHDAARMLENWGKPLDLNAPGLSIKKYPCVYSIHGGIDAAIQLRDREGLKADDIARVTVRMHARRLLPHVRNAPADALNAKFSLPYAIARALIDGAVTLDHFTDEAVRDGTVARIMAVIETQEHHDDSNDYGADITVVTKDGRTLAASVAAPLGRGPEAPLPPSMLATKFADCAGRALETDRIDAVFATILDLESLPSIADLTGMIETATRS